MSHHKSFSISSLLLPVLFALMLALVFSCSEQPMSTDKGGDSGLTGSGKIDPGATTSFLLGSVSDTVVAPGRIEVWASNIAFDDSTGIVSLDVQLVNRTQRTLFPPVRFVITNIVPQDIAVVGFDGSSGDGFPYYDFSGKLGDDNMLEPEEQTAAVRMQFHTVTLRSFAIGFRIELGPAGGTGIIGGVVYQDLNQNGERDRCGRCEPGIPDITVVLQKRSEDDKTVMIAVTDSVGEYRFTGLGEGVYRVAVIADTQVWKVTSTNPLLVMLLTGLDGKVQDFLEAHFGLIPVAQPVPDNLFGPIIIGPRTQYGAVLDSAFVDPPSPLPVVFAYYLEVAEPPFMTPVQGIVDSAGAWINGEKVFEYYRTEPPDTAYFMPQRIQIREGLIVTDARNSIRLLTAGNEAAALTWRVYKRPWAR